MDGMKIEVKKIIMFLSGVFEKMSSWYIKNLMYASTF